MPLRFRFRLAAGVALAATLLGLCPANAAAPPTVAFIDVNVLPMDSDRVLRHQTVVISGRIITAVGPTGAIAVPRGARLVEGAGRWIAPGLADMHAHVNDDAELAMFIRHGVTTTLHMGGADPARIGSIRQAISTGTLVGPNLYYALLVDGVPTEPAIVVKTPAEARQAVARAKAQGFDFIKVYNSLTAEAFDAIVDEGRAQGTPVVGHGVRAVGLPAGLMRGQVMVAHAEEFYYTAFHNQPDHQLIPSVVAATRQSGAWVTPNLSGFTAIAEQWGRPSVAMSYLVTPAAAGLSATTRERWAAAPYGQRAGDLSSMLQFLQEFTKALSDAGVPLLAGTDTPFIPGMAPGSSVHDDLDALRAAGLTPYQALVAATRSPGAFAAQNLPASEHFGQIAVGMRADLVLVRGNPLQDLSVLREPDGVMVAGRWHALR